MAFSGNQSVVFIIALNKLGSPSLVYSLDFRLKDLQSNDDLAC